MIFICEVKTLVDGSIRINTKINNSGIKSGAKEIELELKKTQKNIENLTGKKINIEIKLEDTDRQITEIQNKTKEIYKDFAGIGGKDYTKSLVNNDLSKNTDYQKLLKTQEELNSKVGTYETKIQQAKDKETELNGELNKAKANQENLNNKIISGSKNYSKMNNEVTTISNSLKKVMGLIGTVFSISQIAKFSKECVNEASKMQSALLGLQSIVEGQGRSFKIAKSFIDSYTEDGLIPATNAITAYKNLASRNYNDDQIQKTMLALKDSAAFGRQSSYSYGEAIQSATEGLKNENSVLVDNAGVTKNVAKMWDDYARSIGTTSNKLTQQQKIQAEVNGILQETKFQTGDAIKYAQTYEGQTSRLSASFLRLRQNIGTLMQGMFGTVINLASKAIEGVNVFVQAIGRVIQMFTGKNPLESLSSGIKDTSNQVGDIGINADTSGKKVKKLQKQLAGFDEVQVLSNNKDDSSGSSGTGGIKGGSSGSLGNLGLDTGLTNKASKEIDKLAKKIKSFLDSTMKILNKYEPLLKGIGAGFLTAFGFKWITSALSKFVSLNGISLILGAIKKALLESIIVFNLTHNPLTALTAGFSSLWKSLMNFLGGLSPIVKLGVSLVSLVATFVTTSNAIKNFTLGTSDLGTTLLNIVPVAGVAGVALYGMLGPVGLILEGVTLLIGGFVGLNNAQVELRKQLNDNIMYENTGIKIDTLTEQLVENNKEFNNSIQRVSEWGDTIEENNKKIEDNISTIGYYTDKVIYGGSITQEETQKMITAFSEVRESVKENFELSTKGILETFKVTLSGVAEDVGIDMKTISGHVFEFQNLFGQKTNELESNIKSLEEQMLKSGPTQELLQKYAELQDQYIGLNSEVPLATTRFQEQIKAFNEGKIKFEDTETAKTKIQELGSTFEELMKGIGENKEQTLNEFDNLIKRVPLVVSDPERQQELIQAFEGYKETTRKGFELKEEDIKIQFYTQVQRIQKSFDQNLNEIAETTPVTFWESLSIGMSNQAGTWEKEMDKTIREKVANMNKPMQDEINKLIKQTTPKSVELGENIPIKLGEGIDSKESIPRQKVDELINQLQTTAQNKELIKQYLLAGNNIDEGLAKGLKDKMGIPEQEAKNLGDQVIKATRQALDSHSPSREFIKIGQDTGEGLGIGIENRKNYVLDKARNLIWELENQFRNMNLSFNINFPDITWSSNNLIYQFELMLNRIRDGLNTWLSRTTSSLNGLYIYGEGKVGYSSISRINIPRLAKGGITYRPTYAQIGEAGKEAVLPLQNYTEWMDTLADKIANKISTGEGEITLVLNNYMDTDLVERKVIKRKKRNEFAMNGG